MKINIDIGKIKSQVSKQLSQIAKRAGEEIQQAYASSVQQFYGAYSPKWYNRTFSLFTGSSAYGGRPTYKKIGDMKYSCGISAGPQYYSGNPYSGTGELYVTPGMVWNSSYMGGMHGVAEGLVAAVTASPQSVMQGKFEAIKGQVESALGNITISL